MICVIDNYDSFTYNLVDYLKRHGQEVEVFRNTQSLAEIDFKKYQGILLSPGPSTPDKSALTLDVIRNIRLPMLGVCLGMQAIAYVFGAGIIHAQRTMHGKIDRINHLGGTLFTGIPASFQAVRYHSLAVSAQNLPDCLVPVAFASDGELMALKHHHLPIWAVQFHPESYLTEHGMALIKNFIGGCYANRTG